MEPQYWAGDIGSAEENRQLEAARRGKLEAFSVIGKPRCCPGH